MAQPPKKAPPKPVETISDPVSDVARLPAQVARMRDKLIEAAQSKDIEQLRAPIEFNETPPLFEIGAKRPRGFGEIVEFLKARSFDGKGREILDILEAVMREPYVVVKRGPFETYVWPALAFKPAVAGEEDQQRAQWRCIRFADALALDAEGKPLIQRVRIGSDGTWHTFTAGG